MFYLFPLALVAAIALTIWFVFISDAALIAKVVIGALFIISFFLHPAIFLLAGFFLRIVISIFILFYQMFQTAKSQ